MKTEAKLKLEHLLQEWYDSDEFVENIESYIPKDGVDQFVNAIDGVLENWKAYEKQFGNE